METVKLGEKGQVSVPKEVMDRLGLRGGETLLLEVSEEGALVLRPVNFPPVEIYDEGRVREFLEANRLTEEEREQLSRVARERRAEPR